MKILNSILSGATAAIKSWKGILITWLFSLILVTVLAIPFRSAIKSAVGNSIITEKIAQGLTSEIFTDLGSSAKILMSFFSYGLLFLLFIGFLMNVFLNGGQFSFLRKDASNLTTSEFFRASGRNFWSFLVITIISRIVINFLTGITILAPVIILSTNRSISLNTSVTVLSIAAAVSIIVISTMLLVTDYARAWQVSNEKLNGFKALGFGFSETFGRFWSSMPLMVLMLIIQILFIWLVFVLVSGWMPKTGGEVVILFIGTQILFIIKIFMRLWRYGSVTALMENNEEVAKTTDQYSQGLDEGTVRYLDN